MAARFTRLAVVTTPERLTVRNFWTTRHIPWRDVEKIEPPRPLGSTSVGAHGNTGTGLRITVQGGSVIVANAFARRTGDPEDFADAVVKELRQMMSVYRKAH